MPALPARTPLSAFVLTLGAAWLAASPAGVEAQVPGSTVTISSAMQPQPGPGNGQWLPPERKRTWSQPGGGAGGWSQIRLFDINRDGKADLCGLYQLGATTHAYGCVLNQGNDSFGGNLIQAVAFNGSPNASVHTTIQLVDFDGNGSAHLCGRTITGVQCQKFNGTAFNAPVLVSAMFSDANYWNQEQYHSTIGFGKLGGVPAVCGRGVGGVMCFRKNGNVFGTTPSWQTAFSDANGWAEPQHFRTLRFVDIDRNGSTDVCGRGYAGIYCAVWRGAPFHAFGPAVLLTNQFADPWWIDPKYFSSIRYGDVSFDYYNAAGQPTSIGSIDVCGRGSGGVYCAINHSTGVSGVTPAVGAGTLVIPQMRDAEGYGVPSLLQSFQIVDFDGDGIGDVCALNNSLFCAKSRSTPTGPVFDAPVERTDSVGAIGPVISARIYASGRFGFCWAEAGGGVGCSVEWP